jgi:hypothetical protein
MPLQVKLIFTCATIVIGVAVLFIDVKADNAGPNWFWRGGKSDLMRNAICRPDGSFRKYTKGGILTCLALLVAALWLVG